MSAQTLSNNAKSPSMRGLTGISFSFVNGNDLHQESGYKSQDGIKLRKCGVNHRIGLHIVSLRDAHNTVGTNLSLTDGGKQAYQTNTETHTKPQGTCFSRHLAEVEQKGQEAVKSLCGRKRGKNHITS